MLHKNPILKWCPHGEGEGVPKKQMIVLISCVSVTVTRGKGGKKFQKFCGRHLSMVPQTKIQTLSCVPRTLNAIFFLPQWLRMLWKGNDDQNIWPLQSVYRPSLAWDNIDFHYIGPVNAPQPKESWLFLTTGALSGRSSLYCTQVLYTGGRVSQFY